MITRIALIAGLVSLASVATAEEMVPLKTELPKPMFVGTPKPVNLPNLEKPRTGKRPDFMVPAGTVNLALNKPVTASDEFPVIGELEFITDGEKEGGDGYFVELGPDLQWVQIDLEEPAKIYAILVWHYHLSPRAYHDVVVQVADDAEFTQNVRTVFNNDHDNSSGLGRGSDPAYIESYEGRLIPVDGEVARFVRLYSRGNTSDSMNHYVEVEVFGKPAS
ncbi:MAG: hypothetical protein D6781_14085 [Verrucomicrobia bacterium]|nr:MAG: hypothetical protein D6781_14085 [Verrucomicrobiota bacterium]